MNKKKLKEYLLDLFEKTKSKKQKAIIIQILRQNDLINTRSELCDDFYNCAYCGVFSHKKDQVMIPHSRRGKNPSRIAICRTCNRNFEKSKYNTYKQFLKGKYE